MAHISTLCWTVPRDVSGLATFVAYLVLGLPLRTIPGNVASLTASVADNITRTIFLNVARPAAFMTDLQLID